MNLNSILLSGRRSMNQFNMADWAKGVQYLLTKFYWENGY